MNPAADARLLVVALVVGAAPFNPGFSLRWGAVICAVMLLTAAGQVRVRRPDVLAGSFLVLGFASQSWTRSPDYSALAVENLTACVILFITVRSLVTSRHDAGIIGAGYLAGCLYTTWQLYQVRGDRSLLSAADTYASRVTLDGSNANYLSYSLVAGLVVIVLLWRTLPPSPSTGLVMIGTGLIFIAGIGLTGTRGSQLAVLALLAWVVVARSNPRRWLRLALAAVAAVNAVIVLGILDTQVQERLTRSARETGDLNGRFPSWVQGRSVFRDNIFYGAGIDAFRSLNAFQINAHNFILDTGSGLGLLGVGLLLTVLYAALFTSTRGGDEKTRAFVVGAWIAAIAPILSSGVWLQAAPLWVTLALVSTLPVLSRRAGAPTFDASRSEPTSTGGQRRP